MVEVELNIEDYYFDEKPGISFSIDAVVSICIETDITSIDYEREEVLVKFNYDVDDDSTTISAIIVRGGK